VIRRLFSQAGQDLWVIRDVFDYARSGYFVDIGAADGINLSNTYALERYFGWQGICVEANPETFLKLHARRRAKCVNACIADEVRSVAFDGSKGFFSGIVATTEEATTTLQTMTFADLIQSESIPKTIDYLSLDVEGAEEQVMETFPFETHRFLCATIERPSAKLRATLESQGYRLVAELCNLDAFYLHPDLILSYNIRAQISAARRALPPPLRIAELLKWVARHGIRAALARL